MVKIQKARKEECCQTAVKFEKIRRKEKLLGCINFTNPSIYTALTALVHYDSRCFVL